MAAGYEVSKSLIDMKTGDSVLALRQSFEKIETVAKWLTTQVDTENGDPLLGMGYSADEAYLIRNTFEQLEALRTSNTALWEQARKLTGLE